MIQTDDAQDPRWLEQRQVAAAVESARDACLAESGGCELLRHLSHCLAVELMPPQWLRDAFIARRRRVVDAFVGTWDDAFGRPWPAHTRLHTVRKRRELRERVYNEAWQLTRGRSSVSINRALFEQISHRLNAGISGGTAENLYYEAIEEGGRPSIAELRSQTRAS